MSLKLTLISFLAIVLCFLDKISALNSTMRDNILMELNNTTVLQNPDILEMAKLNNETGIAEHKNVTQDLDVTELDNDKQFWQVRIGKKFLDEKNKHGSKYSKKQSEQKQKENWTKEQTDKSQTHDGENKKLHKWGKNKGEILLNKLSWDKAYGLIEEAEKLKGHNEENHRKSHGQKGSMKKYQEENSNTQELKDIQYVKEWKELVKKNKEQAAKKPEMISWSERKPVYIKYKKEMEQHGQQAKKQGYILVNSSPGYVGQNDLGYQYVDYVTEY